MPFAFPLPTTNSLLFQTHLISPSHPSLPHHASVARQSLRTRLKRHRRLPTARDRASHLPAVYAALLEYIPFLVVVARGLETTAAQGGAQGGGVQGGRLGTERDWEGRPDARGVQIVLRQEVVVSWRPAIGRRRGLGGAALPLRGTAATHYRSKGAGSGGGGRVHAVGISAEVYFVLTTLGCVLANMARSRLGQTLYAARTPTAEERSAACAAATRLVLQAATVHTLLATYPYPAVAGCGDTAGAGAGSERPDISTEARCAAAADLEPSVQHALASLAMAEATLLCVLKDDCYMAAAIQARNVHDRDWMVKPPDIPSVRASLLTRLCVRAAEYVEAALATAAASDKGARVDSALIDYMRALVRTCRTRACRFVAVDADTRGRTGEAIAWLRAGRAELGMRADLGGDGPGIGSTVDGDSGGSGMGRVSGLGSRLRRGLAARWEEHKVERQAAAGGGGGSGGRDDGETEIPHGDDAGREEEGNVLDMLEGKWDKMNNTINTQAIPPSSGLAAKLPSGRDIHLPPAPYTLPQLDDGTLAALRAAPGPETMDEAEADSSEEEGYY